MQRLEKLRIAAVAMITLGAGTAGAAPIVFENSDVKLTVFGGEANNGLTTFGGYFSFVDKAFSNEETSWSIDPVFINPAGAATVLSNGSAGGLSSPSALGTSTATVGGINVSATTILIGRTASTTTTFTAPVGGTLAGNTFVFYAENDIFSVSDSASFEGSIAGGNLVLKQYDTNVQSLTVVLTPGPTTNATLSLFGSGEYTGFGNAIAAGNLSVLSADGSNFDSAGDIGQALAFNLTGQTASVTVNYTTQSVVPEPASLGVIGLGTLSVLRRRRK